MLGNLVSSPVFRIVEMNVSAYVECVVKKRNVLSNFFTD